MSSAKSGVWVSLVKFCSSLNHFGVDLNEIMVRKICNGTNILFWLDSWIEGCRPLKERFPRLFALEQHKSCSVAERWAFSNGVWAANWVWNIEIQNLGFTSLPKTYALNLITNVRLTGTITFLRWPMAALKGDTPPYSGIWYPKTCATITL
ncbi:reverse transcriptase domain, Reverse transcriptase zinc-binding domain protein [Artemisia annua]|uniref:Reverse transcriptase domain, Reverse transcriptase zinc-binding domain protein n=1 Tax=Artemisia annua TaxID=35608 RepID=A0A2U1LWT9_ARTAN|nr:reverse transcriptase domain, Reverse transcriptase zinc-binding domain protein [Artemisia annua]